MVNFIYFTFLETLGDHASKMNLKDCEISHLWKIIYPISKESEYENKSKLNKLKGRSDYLIISKCFIYNLHLPRIKTGVLCQTNSSIKTLKQGSICTRALNLAEITEPILLLFLLLSNILLSQYLNRFNLTSEKQSKYLGQVSYKDFQTKI